MLLSEFLLSVGAYIRNTGNAQIDAVLTSITRSVLLDFTTYHKWLNTIETFSFTTGKSAIALTNVDFTNTQVTVAVEDAFKFKAGDTITIANTTGAAIDLDYTILSVDYDTGVISFPTTTSFTNPTYTIDTADHDPAVGNDFVIVDGDATAIVAGDFITIASSTANDGIYIVASIDDYDSDNDQTTIYFTTGLIDSTGDGTVQVIFTISGDVTSTTETYRMPDGFVSERDLFDAGGTAIDKVTYGEYLSSSSSNYAVVGRFVHVAGTDATYNMLYTTKGGDLSESTDSNDVLDHYENVITQWVIYRFLIWYGDDESAAREEATLKLTLDSLKRSEARTAKEGRTVRISSYNRT